MRKRAGRGQRAKAVGFRGEYQSAVHLWSTLHLHCDPAPRALEHTMVIPVLSGGRFTVTTILLLSGAVIPVGTTSNIGYWPQWVSYMEFMTPLPRSSISCSSSAKPSMLAAQVCGPSCSCPSQTRRLCPSTSPEGKTTPTERIFRRPHS